jgi:hypothetical protein
VATYSLFRETARSTTRGSAVDFHPSGTITGSPLSLRPNSADPAFSILLSLRTLDQFLPPSLDRKTVRRPATTTRLRLTGCAAIRTVFFTGGEKGTGIQMGNHR